MGGWYWIGVALGLGVALGVLVAVVVPRAVLAVAPALVAGAVAGYLVHGWSGAIAGAVGGGAGVLGAIPVVAGALRRGGTRAGIGLFVGLGALALAALAFVPVVGYLEALAVPLVGLRLRSRAPERHAGLRSLARD